MGCTFCAIPQFRGKHRSRALTDIVAEVERARPARHPGGDPGVAGHARLRARPARQRRHRRPAPGAVRHADAVDPARCTSTPPTSPSASIDEVAPRARVVPYLDMPVQHGDDAILRAMRRGGDRPAHEGHRRAAARRDSRRHPAHHACWWASPARPRPRSRTCSPSSRTWRFDRLGVFTYSVEEGTPAADMPDQVPGRGDGRARAAGAGPPGSPGVAAPEGALRHAADRAGGRAERRIPRFPSRAAPRARRPRSTAWCCCATRALTPGRFAEVGIVEVDGYELVGE